MRKKVKTILLGSIANVFEWYDYALFGHFATLIGDKFFPGHDPDIALLKAFMVFALGYLIRPVGGVVFGMIGDKWGRKASLSLAIICMSFPTMLIGLLPTYNDIGIVATIIMIIARAVQGLSMGGALTGSISFTIEHTRRHRQGIVGSLSMAGAALGILMGSVVVNAIKYFMSPDNFHSWGWRIPFLIGFFILIVGLYIKKHLTETPMFEAVKDTGHIAESPLKNVLVCHWFDIIVTIMFDSIGCVTFYIAAIYTISYFEKLHFSAGYMWYLTAFCNFITAVVMILSGWISDYLGSRRVMVFSAILIMISAPFIMYAFDTGDQFLALVAQMGLSMLAAGYLGSEPAMLVRFYPINVRSTALALSYNVSATIFAGATPYLVALIVYHFGKMIYIAWYIELCAVMSLIGLFFYKDRSMQLTD